MTAPARRLGRHIELIGLPGAGKTTLLERLRGLALSGRIKLPPLLPPLDPGGAATMRHTLSIASRLAIASRGQTLPFLATADGRWLLTKLGYRAAAIARRGDTATGAILVDGGVLQPLASFPAEFRRGSGRATPLGDLLAIMTLPAAVIELQIAPELALSRYRQRQAATSRRADAVTSIEGFREAADICTFLASAVQSAGGRVIRIDTAQSFDDDDLVAMAQRIRARAENPEDIHNR